MPGTGLARDAGPVARFAMRRVLPALTLTPLALSPGAESYDPGREAALLETLDGLTAPRTGRTAGQ